MKNIIHFILTALLLSSAAFADHHAPTQVQQQWLDEHPNIRIGIDPDFYPIEFVGDDGVFSGISADITQAINTNLDINMKPSYGLNWSEVMQGIENHTIDVLSAMTPTEAANKFLLFSKPYLHSSIVVITTRDHAPIKTSIKTSKDEKYSLESLYGEKVAITKNYPEHHKMIEQWPKVKLLPYETTLKALQSLSNGESTAAIVNLDTAQPLIHAHNLTNIRIEDNAFNETIPVHFAVRKDWPELVNIINIGIDDIGVHEVERIARKWRSSPVIIGIDKDYAYRFLIILISIIFVSFAWLYSINRIKNRIKKQNDSNMDRIVHQSRHVVMGEMIATLTHQWKQPLTALMLKAGLVKDQVKTLNLTTKEQDLLLNNLSRMEEILGEQNLLIQDFRDFFHPNKECAWFNVGHTIEASIAALKDLFDKHNIHLHFKIDNSLRIYGYERDLRHIMLNVFQNALDQAIHKKIQQPLIKIRAIAKNNIVEITIEDNAGGVNNNIIKTLFEPYVSTKKLNGTGLGLYIGRRIAQESFKGDISVENTKIGAKFTLTLLLDRRKESH